MSTLAQFVSSKYRPVYFLVQHMHLQTHDHAYSFTFCCLQKSENIQHYTLFQLKIDWQIKKDAIQKKFHVSYYQKKQRKPGVSLLHLNKNTEDLGDDDLRFKTLCPAGGRGHSWVRHNSVELVALPHTQHSYNET